MLNLSWIKCGEPGHWCPFDNVNLSTVNASGIYIIWHDGNPARVVRVGQGNIAERIKAHRNDSEIVAYRQSGTLRVTWATVPAAQQDGVECYLADRWTPLVGDAFPDAEPIVVNDPW